MRLISHAKEDEVVSKWKGFFARKNTKMEIENGGDETVKEEDIGVRLMNEYPVLSVTEEQYMACSRPWMNSLIIKVLGLSVLKHVLVDRVRRMWKPLQSLKVFLLSNEYYVVSFSSMDDRKYACYEDFRFVVGVLYGGIIRHYQEYDPIDRLTSIYDKGCMGMELSDVHIEWRLKLEKIGVIRNKRWLLKNRVWG
ncbi:hypothetical protein K1719_032532 [Acacia pycnantha]|nr:hypothetical protein K1719_032532 [Acacia pycnantha]